MTKCRNCGEDIEMILDACERPIWYGVETGSDVCNTKEGYPYHEPASEQERVEK